MRDNTKEFIPDSAGSTIRSVHTSREAKVYAVFESEIESIGLMNAISNLSFAGSMSFLSFWFALYIERQVTPSATPQGEVLLNTGPTICQIGAAGCSIIAFLAWIKRGAIIKKIKKEANERNSGLDAEI